MPTLLMRIGFCRRAGSRFRSFPWAPQALVSRGRAGRDILQAMPPAFVFPRRLQPMLATLIDKPFDDPDWVFETKWEGFRVVTSIERGKVKLYSRNGLIVNDRYPPVAAALAKLKRDAVLDGELAAFDPHDISRFQLLQNALRSEARLQYCLFDVMFLDGEDLRQFSLIECKERLKRVLPEGPITLCLPLASTGPSTGSRSSTRPRGEGLKGSWRSAR